MLRTSRSIALTCLAVLGASLTGAAPTARAAECHPRLQLEAEFYITPIPDSETVPFQSMYASCVATGDWNEDGKTDVAVASVCVDCGRWGKPFVPAVITFIGEGNFRIGSRTSIPLDMDPTWVVARDMDGDGHQDLVVTGDRGTRILAGDGTGRFREAEAFAEPGSRISIGDLDGDGSPDIVLEPLRYGLYSAPYVPDLTIILRGTSERRVIPGGWLVSVLADFDHDGDLDLAASGPRVWINDGYAHFSGPTSYLADCGGDYVDAGDVNGDSHMDLFGVSGGPYGCDRLLLGKGDGTFHAAAIPGAAQPVNDSRPSGRAGIIESEGGPPTPADPHETPQSQRHVPSQPWFVVLVDLNGDGKADPVRIGGESGHELNYRHSIGSPQMACAADMNSDGKPDAIVAGFNGIAIHPGNGDWKFRSNGSAWTYHPHVDVELADIDGDGRRDLALTTDWNELVVALTAPDGGVQRIIRNQVFPGSGSIALADFDGDDHADLLDAYDGVYLGNGDGTFRMPPIAAPFGVPGDFDEDGRMDVASPLGQTVHLSLGNGDGTFRAGPGIVVEANGLQAADVDHDGHMDLVATVPGTISVVYGRGDGTAAEIVKIASTYPTTVPLGDFDGDGLLDLIASSPTGTVVYLGRGRTFVRSPYVGAPVGPAIGDLDGDGHLDLMAGSVWFGRGDGTFDREDAGYGPGGYTLVDDRDGDGLGDVVIVGTYDEDGYENLVTLIPNRTKQNHAPVTASARASVGLTWPPNGEFAGVVIAGVTDPDGDPVTITCTGVTQDEPASSRPAGTPQHRSAKHESCSDATILPDGASRVRLARDGSGNGRVYEIAYSASDGCGGTTSGRVSVCVPHEFGEACIDDGQRYSSLSCGSPFAAQGADGREEPLSVERLGPGRWAIRYALAAPTDVQLDVFDLLGRRVASLDSGRRERGRHELAWAPAQQNGVFFVRMTAGGRSLVRRCIALE